MHEDLEAVELDWLERFALSENRESLLAELIPGTHDYYHFTTLHYQTTGQFDKAAATLADWTNDENANDSPMLVAFTDRQKLLTFSEDPAGATKYWVNRLDLKLDHAPPITNQQRRYSDVVDASFFAADKALDVSLEQNSELFQPGVFILADKILDSKNQRYRKATARFALSKLTDFSYPRIAELVTAELLQRESAARKFGDLESHQELTLSQLQQLRLDVPEIADSGALINELLLRMQPTDKSTLSDDPAARRDYLQTLWNFVETLPPTFNSLKAQTVYRLLETNLSLDKFDRDLFLKYLSLPRNSAIVPRDLFTTHEVVAASLQTDHTRWIDVPPVKNEEAIVRTYLEHFLKNADDTSMFAGRIETDYLQNVFAETKLLYGVEPTSRFFAMLSPTQQRELKDRVELQLTPLNRAAPEASQDAKLSIDVKAVKSLIVRTYKINSTAFYRTHDKILNSDVDLDGLIPTKQTTYEYSQAMQIRHRETIDLPEIKGRGIWVLDVLGGGLRCRAVLRRGKLDAIDRVGEDGHNLTIINEDNQRVAGATVRLGWRSFTADDQGRVSIPFAQQAATEIAILSDDQFASPYQFKHLSESYQLNASMLLSRENLQPGEKAEIAIAAQLRNHNHDVSLGRIEKGTATITATDHSGIVTTRRFEDVQFADDREVTLEFRVPENCRNISVQLEAELIRGNDNVRQTLTQNRSWDIAKFLDTDWISDAFLTRDLDEWVIEVRGRNGEPLAGAAVHLGFGTRLSNHVSFTMTQTNDAGTVRIPADPLLRFVSADIQGGPDRRWEFAQELAPLPTSTKFATVDDTIQIPIVAYNGIIPEVSRYQLWLMRGNRKAEDASSYLKIGSGVLKLGPLPVGKYLLRDRELAEQCEIESYNAPVIDGVLVSQNVAAQVELKKPFSIGDIELNEQSLNIKINDATKFTRIHLLASRYINLDRTTRLSILPSNAQSHYRLNPPNVFISGLKLGDEYQYVLRRQNAKKYPGVMLPQPSLLLNPWMIAQAENTLQQAHAGEAPPAAPMASQPKSEALFGRDYAFSQAADDAQAYDFLANPSLVLCNLEVTDGVVTFPRELLADHPILTILAVDPSQCLTRQIYLPLPRLKTVDLRLEPNVDLNRSVMQRRMLQYIDADHPVALEDFKDGKVQLYRTIGELFPLLKNLADDDRMDQFAVLGKWHKFSEIEKLEAYAKLACHELHLFLYMKDRAFFNQHVKIYLTNKKEPQFIDRWLLEEDLEQYQTPWRYQLLNSLERALLAHRIPELKPAIVKQFKEIVELSKITPELLRRRLDSAMLGLDMYDNLRGLSQANLGGGFGGGLVVGGGLGGGGGGGGGSFGEVAVEMLEPQSQASMKSQKMDLFRNVVSAKRRVTRSDEGTGGRLDNYYAFDGLNAVRPERMSEFYQRLGKTRQWAESQYDQVRINEIGPDLIEPNRFWLDVAVADSLDSIRSINVLEATNDRHSALAAIALIDLPFESEFELPNDEAAVVAPEQGLLAVSMQRVELHQDSNAAKMLVGQSVISVQDVEQERNESFSSVKAINRDIQEYLVNKRYLAQITVTNLEVSQQLVEVAWQIPAGAIVVPYHESDLDYYTAVDSKSIQIGSHETATIEVAFYFPQAGTFQQYPAIVLRDDELLARTELKNFSVVERATREDNNAWPYLANVGSATQISEYLNSHNFRGIDWHLTYHRLDEADVYAVIQKAMQDNLYCEQTVLDYAFAHDDRAAMSTRLSMDEGLVKSLGPVLQSDLLTLDPIERFLIELLEFSPLVAPRIHQLRQAPEITNAKLATQYRELLKAIAYSKNIGTANSLSVVYYQLINNRIEDALQRFSKIKRNDTSLKIQYDYLDAYFALQQAEVQRADAIVSRYTEFAIPRWQQRFAEIAKQVREIRHLQHIEPAANIDIDSDKGIEQVAGDLAVIDRQQRQGENAVQQSAVTLTLDEEQIKIDYANSTSAVINLYAVDLELLFSNNPFVRDGLERMAISQPTFSQTLQLEKASGLATFDLPTAMKNQTVLVEVICDSARHTILHYGGQLSTYVSESFGQVQVVHASSRQPLPSVYVKVYARHNDGGIRFYKDGYTDLRGRFDYASISNDDLATAERFAILVLDSENGASLHEVGPPK